MSKGTTKAPKLTIPSSQKHLREAVDFIEALAKRMGFNQDAIADIAISVSEAVNNAILHGNRKDEKKKVTILAEPGKRQITIHVRDQGTPFCPEDVCNPLAPENLMKCNGRGILILRTLMDTVTFASGPGGGTEVTMTKRLRKSPGTGKS